MTSTQNSLSPVAVVTGGSHGLGRALAASLISDGWQVVTDGRRATDLARAAAAIDSPRLTALPGDVADPAHRDALAAAATSLGAVALLVNNASTLGPSPLPPLRDYPVDELRSVYDVNVFAPLELTQLLLPSLRAAAGVVVNVSSDAAVEAYGGWGGYGSAKAAFDHVTAVLAVEEPDLGVYAFDPGDMRTDMHQLAFPDEDISDRPSVDAVVPHLRALIAQRRASGRYRVTDFDLVDSDTVGAAS
jgi:NAD(P)-dependent dehydrogenase (short-subunit alcohol dehydrogenase family)